MLTCALVAGVAFSPLGTALYDKYDPRLYPGAWLNHPFKTVDPNDPNFDPLRFRYMDYRTEELAAVFGRMFKPGDSRAYVEAVLVQSAGSERRLLIQDYDVYIWKYSSRYIAHWQNPNRLRVNIEVAYNNDGSLLAMQMRPDAFEDKLWFTVNEDGLKETRGRYIRQDQNLTKMFK